MNGQMDKEGNGLELSSFDCSGEPESSAKQNRLNLISII